MGVDKTNKKNSITEEYSCVLCNKNCTFGSLDSLPVPFFDDAKCNNAYQDIVKCLNCSILINAISSNPNLQRFITAIGTHFFALMQKKELDEMLLNKQKFSLQHIQKENQDHRTQLTHQEKVMQLRIRRYEYLLSKRNVFLQTLQKLSLLIGETQNPDIMWKHTSGLLTKKLLDLEAVGLLILEKDRCRIKMHYTEFLPARIANLMEACFSHEDFCARFTDKEAYVSLYQIYWEGHGTRKRLGPRTEEMLERCILFPIKGYQSLSGIFVVLMKDFSSSSEELAPFFTTAARLIVEGISSVAIKRC